MADDPVEDFFARALAQRGSVPSRPDAAAIQMRDRITAPSVAPRRSFSVPRRVALAAMAAVVAVLFAVISPLWAVPQAAVAVTPTPLHFSGHWNARDVRRLVDHRASTVVTTATRRSHAVSWVLDVDQVAQRSMISPQVTTLTWNEDLSGRSIVAAGQPYWPDGVAPRPDAPEPPAPGTILTDMSFPAGAFGSPQVAVPGGSEADVLAMLHAYGLPESYTAGELMEMILSAQLMWTLTDAQHTQLVHLLLATGDVRVLGESKDREGRRVVGLQAPVTGLGTVDTVLVSVSTGRIVGLESVAVKKNGLVPAGAVVSYRMWDVEK